MVKHCSIRFLISIVNQYNMVFKQLDVKTIFLQGTLEEMVYMYQLEGFVKVQGNVSLEEIFLWFETKSKVAILKI